MLGRSFNSRDMRRYVALSQVGLEMAAPIIVGAILDYQFEWSPWGVIVGAVLGLTLGLVHLVRLVNREDDKDSSPPTGDAK